MTVSAPVASLRAVELFGGAIIANIPERFVDVSDFRPVPDHQEVPIKIGAAAMAPSCLWAEHLAQHQLQLIKIW